MQHAYAQLVSLIADHWGDAGADPTTTPSGDRVIFTSDEGESRYVVVLPGARPRLRDHEARPFPARRVPVDKMLVQCIVDAPDCWWYVRLDGSYTGLDGSLRRLGSPA